MDLSVYILIIRNNSTNYFKQLIIILRQITKTAMQNEPTWSTFVDFLVHILVEYVKYVVC